MPELLSVSGIHTQTQTLYSNDYIYVASDEIQGMKSNLGPIYARLRSAMIAKTTHLYIM